MLIISLIFDKQIYLFFTSYRITFLNSIAIFIHYIKWYMLFGLVLVVILIRKQYKNIIPLIASLILYVIFTEVLKIVVNRERPYAVLNNSLVQDVNPNKSFPSGHATAMFAFLPFLDFIKYLWLVLGIIVALSRVYLGVHYLSDVIAGVLLGYFIGELSLYLVKKYSKFKLFRSHRKV